MNEPYKMPEQEIALRLTRIEEYNDYQLRAKQPHHCLTEAALARQLVKWGHDPSLAAIGYKPKPSPFLAGIKR